MSTLDEFIRINRGIKRRVNRQRPLDSYPFLSGDSYFFSCEFYFRDGAIHKVSHERGREQKSSSLFLSVARLTEFLKYLTNNPSHDFSSFSLVVHNGDAAVSDSTLNLLLGRFQNLYAVNLLNQSPVCIPIPIGLENKNLFTNGVPGDFKKIISKGLIPFLQRNTLLLQAFSLHTNRVERESCAKVAARLGARKLESVNPREYRQEIASSKFVLSPAGNGQDCHRTWESIYLGAIPVVRRAHWAFSNRELPVLIVDEWSDLLSLDLGSLEIVKNEVWDQKFWDDFYLN
jgi:hypothetical protein